MLPIASAATQKLAGILAARNGLPAAVEALTSQQGVTLPPIAAAADHRSERDAGIAEQSTVSKYPLVYVYCNKAGQ